MSFTFYFHNFADFLLKSILFWKNSNPAKKTLREIPVTSAPWVFLLKNYTLGKARGKNRKINASYSYIRRINF